MQERKPVVMAISFLATIRQRRSRPVVRINFQATEDHALNGRVEILDDAAHTAGRPTFVEAADLGH